jgi:hypothetical protein
MAGDWRDNRKIQFAVGATVIILLIRWLLTGDLLMIAEAARPPVEGETKSLSLLAVIWPMIVEAVIITGISSIAFGLRIWSWVVDLIDNARGVTSAALQTTSAPTLVEASPAALPESRDGLITGLAQAVARNDTETETKLRTQIRLPYAIEELNSEIRDGNFQNADKLMAEIKSLSGKKTAAKGAKNE